MPLPLRFSPMLRQAGRHLPHCSNNRTIAHRLRSVVALCPLQARLESSSTSHLPIYEDEEEVLGDIPNTFRSRSHFGMCPISNRSRRVKIAVIDASGGLTRKEVSMAELRQRTGLHLAELIMVETASIAIAPRIMARTGCIVFNMAHVRALIFKDEVILFALRPTSTQLAVAAKFENSLCDLLRQRAECRTPEDEEDTFELAVMEKCLQSVVNRFTIRVSHCTPMVDRLLRDMSFSEVSSDNLFRMFPLQNALTHYELSLQNILELLRALLNDDDELRNLCISPTIPAVKSEMAEVTEQMLENFHQMFIDLHRRVFQLQASIKSSREIMNIQMAIHRNHLMSLNIRMTVLGVGLSSAAVGATYFGMNLHSGLEAVPGGLFVAAGVCSVIGLSVGKFFLGVAKRGSVMSFANTSQNLADMLPANTLQLAGLGSDPTVPFLGRDSDREGFLTKDDFVMLIRGVDKGATQEEMDLLFEMFDFNHDGMLTYDELMAAVAQLHKSSKGRVATPSPAEAV